MSARRGKSRKQSDSSSPQWPPDPVTFLVDECLGRKVVPQALRDAGCLVLAFDDVLRSGTPDTIWLRRAGSEGWVVITKDDNIRRRSHERRVVSEACVALFTLKFKKGGTGADMAGVLVRALPRIHRFLSKHRPPFIAKITRAASVEMEVEF